MHPHRTRSRKPGRSVSVVATSDGKRVALTAFLSYTVLAGGNAVCIRFSNRELARPCGVRACDLRWPLHCCWGSW
jgi:hypothetical protein